MDLDNYLIDRYEKISHFLKELDNFVKKLDSPYEIVGIKTDGSAYNLIITFQPTKKLYFDETI